MMSDVAKCDATNNVRKKIWIDKFQTVLSLRIVGYFIVYQIAVWAFAITDLRIGPRVAQTMGKDWAASLELLLALTIVGLGGLFVLDAVKTAHKIVGPVYRIRQSMKAIAAGESLDYVRLRKDDMMLELRDDFNEMLRALVERGAVTLKSSDVGSKDAELNSTLQHAG
jgi:hypothetical protein